MLKSTISKTNYQLLDDRIIEVNSVNIENITNPDLVKKIINKLDTEVHYYNVLKKNS